MTGRVERRWRRNIAWTVTFTWGRDTIQRAEQRSPLSLVEVKRGLALIGRELQSVAGARTTLSHQKLVLYGIRIVGFHVRKGPIIVLQAPLCHKEPVGFGCPSWFFMAQERQQLVGPRNNPRHGGGQPWRRVRAISVRKSYSSVTQRVHQAASQSVAQQPPADHRDWEVEGAEN